MDIFHEESLTIGWNCLLEHIELRIPRIASGIIESRTDDDLEAREKRGLQPFSIVAQNSEANEILGVSANDRVSALSLIHI